MGRHAAAGGSLSDLLDVDGGELATGADGLAVRVVRPWAKEKLHYLRRYIEIFTAGMKDKWPHRVYVDLFAGPGRSVIEDSAEEIDGSPLIALHTRYPFTRLFFNDADPVAVQALRTRVGSAAHVTITAEDCNAAALSARDALFSSNLAWSTLGLAFIDPTAFQIGFDAIARLTEERRIDVIITVMASYLKRFIAEPSFEDPLSRYFGSDEWQNLADRRRAGEGVTSRVLLDHYEDRLRTLGYRHFDDRIQIRNTRDSTIYHLVFASRHELGSTFFAAISQRGHSGQSRMDI